MFEELGTETARTADLGLRLGGSDAGWTASVSVFLSDYSDYIVAAPTGGFEDGLPAIEYQATDARFAGAELEWAHPRLAEVTHTARDVGPQRHQSTLERIGQHIGGVKTAFELLGDLPACPPLQAPVCKGQLDDLGHLGHGAVDGRDPRQQKEVFD